MRSIKATGIFPSIPVTDTNVKVTYVLQARSSEDLGGKDLEPLRVLLASFGQADRDKTERDLTGSTVQAAALLNSKFVKDRVKIQEGGRLYKLLNHDPPLSNQEIVDEMFLAFLARPPLAAKQRGNQDSRRTPQSRARRSRLDSDQQTRVSV